MGSFAFSALSGWILLQLFLPNFKALTTFTQTLLLVAALAFLITFVTSTTYAFFSTAPRELKFLDNSDSWLLLILISLFGLGISILLSLMSDRDVSLYSDGVVVTGTVTDKYIDHDCGSKGPPICFRIQYTYIENNQFESFGQDRISEDLFNALEIGKEVEIRYTPNSIYSAVNIGFDGHIFVFFIGGGLWPLYILSLFVINKKRKLEKV